MYIKFTQNVNFEGVDYTSDSESKAVTAETGASLIAAGLAVEVDEERTNVTYSATEGLMGPDGAIPFKLKRLTVEIANINNVGAQPSGSEWLHSAARNLDAFTSYLQFEPSVFFDFGNTASLNIGTEENPYNTVADFNSYMKGDRRGLIAGIKRGNHVYVHGAANTAGLTVKCWGSATAPVLVVPYGDPSLPMPIIDGGEVTGTGTSYVWTVSSGNVWRVAVPNDLDLFEGDTRCLKKNATPAAAGQCQYSGGYLYYWPRSTSNPNDGSIALAFTQWPINMLLPDTATSGFVKFIGLDIRRARGNAIRVAPEGPSVSNMVTVGGIDVLFCRLHKIGFDATSKAGVNGSDTILSWSGPHDTLRMGATEIITSRLIGCELFDGTHHAFEHTSSDNSLSEYNYIHDIWGAAFETFASCSGHTFRNNLCVNMNSVGRLQTNQGSCALLYNWYVPSYNGTLTFDDTHGRNLNNKVYNNYFKDCSHVMFQCIGGSGHAIYNNTVDIDHDAMWGAASYNLPAGLSTDRSSNSPSGTTAAPNGFVTWSNNLLYYRYSPLAFAALGYQNPVFLTIEAGALGANKAIPQGDKNVYFCQVGYGAASWRYNGASEGSLTNYKAAMAPYNLDQNSRAAGGATHPISGASYSNIGDLVVSAEAGKTLINYSEITGRPVSPSPLIQGGANVNANRLTDYIGQTVVAVATPAIGCYER